MIHRIGASSCIKSVAVGEERLSPKLTDYIHHPCGIIRAYVRHVSRLTEMNLDSGELAAEIDISNSCTHDKPLKFFEKVIARYGPEVRKEYF
jgi:hypothetical protein